MSTESTESTESTASLAVRLAAVARESGEMLVAISRVVLQDGSLRTLLLGDVNFLDHGDCHRVISVLPDTVTVGLVVPADSDRWGFLVDGMFVRSEVYFATGTDRR